MAMTILFLRENRKPPSTFSDWPGCSDLLMLMVISGNPDNELVLIVAPMKAKFLYACTYPSCSPAIFFIDS